MESSTRYVDGKKFETFLGRHCIVTDQAAQEGGTDAGPTPPELLLAALGTCAGHYAAEYLRARALSIAGLHVYVSAEKAGRPVRLASFRVEVDMPGIDERHRQGLVRAINACLVHNTLSAPSAMEAVVVSGTIEQSELAGNTPQAPAA